MGKRTVKDIFGSFHRRAATHLSRGFFLSALFFLPLANGPVLAAEAPERAHLGPVQEVFGNLMAQVRWPASRQARLPTLCLLGEDRTTAALALADEPQDFVTLPLAPGMKDFSACDALYLAQYQADGQEALLRKLMERPILTIGPGVEFLDRGGMIAVLGPGRAFYINQGAAWGAGLGLGGELYLEAANFAENDA